MIMLSDNWSDVLIIITLCVVTWGLFIVLIIFLELLLTVTILVVSQILQKIIISSTFCEFFILVKWCYTKISLWNNRLTMQGLPVLTLLLHVIVLAQCQYCSCIYILLPRNSVFSLNSSRTTFSILAAASIFI